MLQELFWSIMMSTHMILFLFQLFMIRLVSDTVIIHDPSKLSVLLALGLD